MRELEDAIPNFSFSIPIVAHALHGQVVTACMSRSRQWEATNVSSSAVITSGIESPLMNGMASPST